MSQTYVTKITSHRNSVCRHYYSLNNHLILFKQETRQTNVQRNSRCITQVQDLATRLVAGRTFLFIVETIMSRCINFQLCVDNSNNSFICFPKSTYISPETGNCECKIIKWNLCVNNYVHSALWPPLRYSCLINCTV